MRSKRFAVPLAERTISNGSRYVPAPENTGGEVADLFDIQADDTCRLHA
jgi:hypothetical protein